MGVMKGAGPVFFMLERSAAQTLFSILKTRIQSKEYKGFGLKNITATFLCIKSQMVQMKIGN